MPEPRTKWDESTTTELQLTNHETTRRLRAINRAPEIVGKLYRNNKKNRLEVDIENCVTQKGVLFSRGKVRKKSS